MWDRVRSHAEVAKGRDDDGYRNAEYDHQPPLFEVGDDGREIIELDVGDPTLFRSEPPFDDQGLLPDPPPPPDPWQRHDR
jgi:hypothetical protein